MRKKYKWMRQLFWYLLFPYFLFAFMQAEFDPFTWSFAARVACVIFSFAWSFLLQLYSSIEEN
jgi:hypothetical protein